MYFLNFLPVFLIFCLYLFIFRRFHILNDQVSSSEHKNFIESKNKPILIGGIYFLTVILIYFPSDFNFLKVIFILVTFLGIASDKNFLPSPKKRILIQIFLLIFLVYLGNLKIYDLRLNFLNTLLENNFFNLVFTVFCLAILINGSNFLDGLNGLLVGYFSLVIISILYLSYNNDFVFISYNDFLKIFLFSVILFYFFNIINLVYLGDSGSYLIAILMGVLLIQVYSNNEYLSPYYVACLLWYPAFENLFSLLRRLYKKIDISRPDNFHLHQLLFFFLKNKSSLVYDKINSLSAAFILIYNLPTFLVASIFPNNSIILLILISFNIFFYLLIYVFLFQNFVKNK